MKAKKSLAGKIGMETRWKRKMLENQNVENDKEITSELQSNNTVITPLLQSNNNEITSYNDKIRIDKIRLDKNIEEYKEKEEEINSSSKRKRSSKPFVKPTIEELDEYIKEKGYHFDAESFFAFYESKGWMIGKNKMKNWKMACVTWENKKTESGFGLFDNSKKENFTNTVFIDGKEGEE